jgi:TP901 family phage tail tape measure protein|nr:MAG TPA: minor tail protein [Caudoviricetes sp.]
MAVNMGTAVAYLELDSSKFQKGFKSAYNDLKVFGDKSATAEQKFKGLSSAFATVGSTMSRSVTLPLVGVGAAALKAGTDFESAMSQVAATMGTTTDKIQNLSKFAQHMGATTAFSATQAAEGLNVLAQSGLTAEEQMTALPEVLNLAAAGNLSLADSSTYVVGTLKGFGKGMDEAKRVTDLVAKGATMANTDVRGLGTALSSSSATAKSYGQNMDSVTLSLLRLAEQNITGEEAATSLNRAMMDLYTPTSTAKKALDELGVSVYDAQGNARDFNDVVDELNGKLSGMSEEQRNAYKNTIFTTYGLQAFNKMTVSSTEKVNNFKEGLKDANDSALKQAQTQLDNLKGDITLFKSALEGAGIVISNVLIPNIRNFIQWLTNLVTKFNELSEEQQNFIVKAGLVIAAIGPVLLILSKVATAVSRTITVFKTFKTTIEAVKTSIDLVKAGYAGLATQMGGIPQIIANLSTGFSGALLPILSVVAVIGTLVAMFVTLWKTNEEFRNNITSTFNELKKVFSDFANEFVSKINELGFNFESITDVIKTAWETLCDIFAPVFEGAFSTVVDIIQLVLNNVLSIMDIFIGVFTGDFEQVADGIKGLFDNIVETFTSIGSTILSTIGDIGAEILEKFGFDEAAQKFQEFFDKVSDIFSRLPEIILGAFDSVKIFFTETIPEVFNNAVETIQGFVNNIISFFTETIPNAFNTFVNETIPNTINAIVTWFSELPYKIGYVIGEMLGHIYLFGQSCIEWATTELPVIIENIVTWFAQLPSRIWEWLLNTINKVIEFGTNLVETGVQAATNFVTNVVTWISTLPSRIYQWLSQTISRVISWGSQLVQSGVQTATNFVSRFISFLQQLPSKVWSIVSQIPSKILAIGSQMYSAGRNILSQLWNGLKSIGESILGWVSDFASKIGSFVSGIISGFKNVVSGANEAKSAAKSVNGKHANGLDYVPFNGYIAELHKGERVLTKQENEEYNNSRDKNSSGDTFNFYNTKPNAYEYARQMKKAKRELLLGF